MMKKRVHELAKDLKTHGIELDNKELVSELQSLGYDVKSHSSSLEDDQALTAVEKIVAKRKPKAAPAPVKAAGFVVRRRPADAAPVREAAPAVEAHAEPVEERAEAQPEPAPYVEARPEPAHVEQPAAAAAAANGEVRAVSEPVAAPQPVAAAAAAAAPQTTRSVTTAPGQRVTVETRPSVAQAAQPTARSGPMGSVQVVTADAARRPTATQAVVVSRPLIPVKRVTPSSTAHKNIPMAPGQKAIGQVKEFKVVPDMLGRGKELVDVSKDKNARKRTKSDEAANLSKQEIIDLARGRTTLAIRGKKKKPTKKGNKTQITQMSADKKVIPIEDAISLRDLSERMGVKAAELIRKLMALGQMATVNQMLDSTTAELLAQPYGWKVEKAGFEETEFIDEAEDKSEDLRPRPPVVTVMGHVDHGKTSLLDAIRQANVAEGEAGGITQHIGAYSVSTARGPVTFLDTPGHEAFTAMRARGAKVTDLVVLVVAADDGVMPQTIESINQAKTAEVPVIVAINKMDKAGANPQQVKNQLMEHGLVPEEYGGETIMVPLSARTKEGLDQLLEMIALQAEVLELKANPSRRANGAIVEAKLDKGRGPVATVLVQDGTLKLGDAIVSGTVSGKIRAMMNERGDNVEEVTPGYPVEVLGLSGVPVAGDDFDVVEDEKVATEIAEHRASEARKKAMAGTTAKATLEGLFAKMQKGEAKELKIIVKADTQGSVEAVAAALEKLSTPKVKNTIIHKAVGGITESDVMRVSGSSTIIVGFNVKPEATAEAIAAQRGVKVKLFDIIYAAVDDVKLAMEDLLEPIRREKAIGKALVKMPIVLPKVGTIAGSAVTEGKITRSAMLRVLRGGQVAFTGKVKSLKRIKDDVREVASPLECGIGIDGFNDVKEGDILEAYEIEEIRQSLS
ncbi:MAG: translation initiation factor IF-2 [Deltaproteobacteria bacterium]|nr:translation initiation factor IF-2 [Deltaproteobacteria bacterium]